MTFLGNGGVPGLEEVGDFVGVDFVGDGDADL
jgi:hypothetical protein